MAPEYLDASGLVIQCAHCRKVRNQQRPGGWDWVPVLVAQTYPMTSHGLCPACLDFYFPASGD